MTCYDGLDPDGIVDDTAWGDLPLAEVDLTMPQYLTCRDARRGRRPRVTVPGDSAAHTVARRWAHAEYAADCARREAQATADTARTALGDGPWDAADLRRWAELDTAALEAASRYQWTAGRGRECAWQLASRLLARAALATTTAALEAADPDDTAALAAALEAAEHRRRRRTDLADMPTCAPPAAAHLTPHAPPRTSAGVHCHTLGASTIT